MADSAKKVSGESKVSQLKSAMKKAPEDKGNGQKEKERPQHTIYTMAEPHAKIVGVHQKIRGFKKLKYQDQISVNQLFKDLYELTGSRMSNVYSITIPNRFSFDPTDQQIVYYVCEKISCEKAWLKTSGRRLSFKILNETGDTLALLERPCKPCNCFSNLFPCCSTQTLDAVLPDGRYFGQIRKVFHLTNPKYLVLDAEGENLFETTIQNFGNICPCWLLTNNIFRVTRLPEEPEDESTKPILINKNCTDTCKENNYTLSVEPVMSNKNKVLLLALIILIDFQHFRRCSTTCHFFIWLLWIALIFTPLFLFFVYAVICGTKGLSCDDFQWPDASSFLPF